MEIEVGDLVVIKEGVTEKSCIYGDYESKDIGIVIGVERDYYFISFEQKSKLTGCNRPYHKVSKKEVEAHYITKTALWKVFK